MEPRVSVIIPCFNQAQWLARAVESALAQGEMCEAVVVNDGSTDETAAAAADLAAWRPGRVVVLTQENRGLSAARQAGLEAARGEFVLFLDADDWLEPGGVAAQLAALEADAGLAGAAGLTRMVRDGAADADAPGKFEETNMLAPRLPLAWPEAAEYNPIGAVHSVLARRAAVVAAGGCHVPGARACEDWDLWARLARAGARMAAVGQVTAVYYQHRAAMTRGTVFMLEEQLACVGRMAGNLSPEQRARAEGACVFHALGALVAGDAETAAVAEVLKFLRGGDETGAEAIDPAFYHRRFSEGAAHAMMLAPEKQGRLKHWRASLRLILAAPGAGGPGLTARLRKECAHMAWSRSPLRGMMKRALRRS